MAPPPKRGKNRFAWAVMANGEIVAMMMDMSCMVGRADDGTGIESNQHEVCERAFLGEIEILTSSVGKRVLWKRWPEIQKQVGILSVLLRLSEIYRVRLGDFLEDSMSWVYWKGGSSIFLYRRLMRTDIIDRTSLRRRMQSDNRDRQVGN